MLHDRCGHVKQGNSVCRQWLAQSPRSREGAGLQCMPHETKLIRVVTSKCGICTLVRWPRCVCALLLRAGARCFSGAPMARRAGGGKSAGWPAWMRASFPPVQGCAVGKPRNPPAHPEGRMPGGRAIGVSFPLGYFSFGQAKEK